MKIVASAATNTIRRRGAGPVFALRSSADEASSVRERESASVAISIATPKFGPDRIAPGMGKMGQDFREQDFCEMVFATAFFNAE
jgi:hypothetical protein